MRDSFDSCVATFTVSGHLILKRHRVKQLNNRNLERHLHHYFGSLWVPARTDGAVARQSCPTRHDKPVKMRCIRKQQILLDGSDVLGFMPTACTKNTTCCLHTAVFVQM